MQDRPSIAIVGTGVGGTELAGYLGVLGYSVRVQDVRSEAVAGIQARGGLDVEGVKNGFAPIRIATTQIDKAVEEADLIIVATVNNAHGEVAKALSPLLHSNQSICLMQGYVGGSLAFRETLARQGCDAQVEIGEIDNFPFTGKILGPSSVFLASLKRRFQIATLYRTASSRLVPMIQQIFPQAEAAPTVLHTAFSTINPIVHVPGMLANIGRIEEGIEFQYYGQGITKRVADVTTELDHERVAVSTAYGVSVDSLERWLFDSYGVEGGNLYETIQTLHHEVFKDSPAPTTLDHRYVTEDVPYGLVPLSELARLVEVPTPLTEALVTLASAALQRDFRNEGRTLDRMGFAGLTADAIGSRVHPQDDENDENTSHVN